MNYLVKRPLLVYNPMAGGGGNDRVFYRFRQKLAAVTEKVTALQVDPTEKNPAGRLKECLAEEVDGIVVMGGDGTLHQVVNLLLQGFPEKGSDLPLSVFPTGSGNDWAGAWGWESQIDDWIEAFERAEFDSADLIEIRGLYSEKYLYALNSMGIGLTGQIVERIEQKRTKKKSAKAKYFGSAFRELFKYSYPPFKINIDGHTLPGDPILTMNLGLFETTGGGMRLFPGHRDEGRMKCTLVNKLSFFSVPKVVFALYFGDISMSSSKVQCQQVEKVVVETTNGQQPLEVDGECYRFQQIEARLKKDKLKVLKPGRIAEQEESLIPLVHERLEGRQLNLGPAFSRPGSHCKFKK